MKALKNNIGNLHLRISSRERKENEGVMEDIFHTKDDTAVNYRPRTRSSVTMWNLPESIVVHVLQGMHIRDILSFRTAHPYFCEIIDNNGGIWASASFADSWPTDRNLHHFVMAAERKNVEAAIKLSVAYLYKEGLLHDDVSKASSEAAKYLCLAETLTPKTFPFFWIFIRPPWSPDGSCCKVQTFQRIQRLLEEEEDIPDVMFGAALILKLQRLSSPEESSNFKNTEDKYFKSAVNKNSAAASFFTLMDVILPQEFDKAKELEKLRLLRQIATSNILEARLNLIKYYAQGYYGGFSKEAAQEYVKNFFTSSKPSGIHHTFKGGRTSDISRYILVDWLVEVVGMKDFSAHVLYFAVSLFDRFLQIRRIQRSQVQLLGVAAIVVSSRFLGFDILTIREAAWLTDNSYSYHDVVRMMGELVAALRGNLRSLTIQDFVKVLLSLSNETGYCAMLVEYISMLCLLQSEMGQYSPAEIAASCLLLSRLLLNQAEPWPDHLKKWTGFTQDYLSLCTFHVYNKCLLEGSEVEYRDTKLQSVKTRYADPFRYSVSNIEIIGHKELCRRLGVTKLVSRGKDTKAIKFRNTDELIMSPRRGMGSDCHCNLSLEDFVDRNQAATPPVKNFYAIDDLVSGYEGDLEDESDESFFDKSDLMCESNEDSDLISSTLADVLDQSIDAGIENGGENSIEDDEEITDPNSTFMEWSSSFISQDEEDEPYQNKMACLSSMCHSGSNLTCHSSQSSPSSCICNCSCKNSFQIGDSENRSAFAAASRLSFSSPSLLSPSQQPCSLSISSSQFPQGNVRFCIPCGNISSATKNSRRNKGVCSNRCDISDQNNSTYDVTSCPSMCQRVSDQNGYFSLRKSKSSDDLPSSTSHVNMENSNVIDQASHGDEKVVSARPTESDSQSNRLSCHVLSASKPRYSCNAGMDFSEDLHTAERFHSDAVKESFAFSFLKDSVEIESNSSSNQICQESSSIIYGTSKNSSSSTMTAESPLVLRSKSSNKSIPYLQQQSFLHMKNMETCNQSTSNSLGEDTYSYLPQKSEAETAHQDETVLTPATPESVTDFLQSNKWTNSLVNKSDEFPSSTFGLASSANFTSKRARLDSSASSYSAIANPTNYSTDDNFELQPCDISNYCCVSDCSHGLGQCEGCDAQNIGTQPSPPKKRKNWV